VEVLERIQAWHKANGAGVQIETLKDQPGWSVRIDLAGTRLSGLTLSPYHEGANPRDWLVYRVQNDKFEGLGDPTKLQSLLYAFLELADRVRR
jgi:hypothetical protein